MSSSTPLLNSGNEVVESNEICLKKLIDVNEAKIQILFSVPMILTNLATYAVPLVSVMFAGHLGHLELAGATLANSWGIVTGFALMTGLSGALETLCGQAYGAKIYRMLGIYLQSSIIVTTFFSVLVSITWIIWICVPSMFVQIFPDTVNCDSISSMLGASIIYTCGANILTDSQVQSWVFGRSISYLDIVESFKFLLPNLKIALPSAIMVCLEYWSFEILVLLAGLMPNSESSTSLIAMCVNTESIAYMITYGFSAAVSTRVSNEIGAGNIKNAKNAVSVTLKLSCFLALTVLLSLAFGHRIWALSFTDSTDIVQQFSYMTPLLSVSILLDSAQGVLSGVARGCGWQHLAAWTNFFAFYMIGMPVALLFGFKFGFFDKGLWMGLCCGLFCQTTILLLLTVRSKWSRIDLAMAQDDQRFLFN